MVKKIALFILAFALVAAVVFTGCAPARRPYYDNTTGNRTGYTGAGTDPDLGNNRGYDTVNNTGAGVNNPGTANYGAGNAPMGIGTGFDTGYGNIGNNTNNGTTGYGNIGNNTNAGTTGYGNGYGTNDIRNNDRTIGFGTNTNGTTGYGNGVNVGNTASYRIENAVRQIEGVQNATAVVNGNTVYVGVTLDGRTGNTGNRTTTGYANNIGFTGNTGYTGMTGTIGNTANASNIERRVSQIVRALETNIATVYVSTDDNFVRRLGTMGQGATGGNVNNTANDFRDLVRGMSPVR